MLRGDSPVKMPWRPQVRDTNPVCHKLALRTRLPAPPVDSSVPASGVRYCSFVLAGALITSATLLGAPALLLKRADDVRRRHFSIDQDLEFSRDPSVHPCDDFYQHVCGRWDANRNRPYRSPLDKYKTAFSSRVFKQLVLRPVPKSSDKARDKASAMLLKCLSRTGRKNTWSLRKVLLELGLPWPEKSPATREALLHILVKASLQFGLHVFWAFYIGPHPLRPYESIVYTSLDKRCVEWIRDFELLIARDRHHDYLRRCAEIVGGTGQSYTNMIEEVTATHFKFAQQVHVLWDLHEVPAFQKLTDPELRRAINSHLPDDSQLWPEEELLNMQPALFDALDTTHLSHGNFTGGFKLLLGAYVVWVLSPFVSRYLTASMLDDIGWAKTEQSHRYQKCLKALEFVMPLAKWRIEEDTQSDRINTWRMLRLSVISFNRLHLVYGAAFTKVFASVVRRVSVNAYNMTITWSTLDRAYAYVRVDSSAGFFDVFLSALRRGAELLKRFMRRPGPTTLHAPGITSVRLYRILVAREVVAPSFLASSPLFDVRHPPAVHAAVLGTMISSQIAILGSYAFYLNERFMHDPSRSIYRDLALLVIDLARYEAMANESNFLPDQTRREMRDVLLAGLAERIASGIARLPEANPTTPDTDRGREPESRPFHGVPPDQLYFLIACLTHCGARGRKLQVKRAICNLAMPSVEDFRHAFRCRPHHRLVTNFTWQKAVTPTMASLQ